MLCVAFCLYKTIHNLHYEQIGKEVRCIEDELPFEIPDSWCWSRFSSLYTLTSGQDLSPNDYNSDKNGVAYITGASNITDEKIDINRWTIHPKSVAYFGDLLFTCKGTVGKMAFLNVEKAHIARQIMSISSPYNLDLYYLKLVLKTNLNSIKIRAKSMIPGISRIDVLNILIPLPPIGEQIRIIDKIKELEPLIKKYNHAEEKLFKLNSNIKEQLKKSILQYAIEGKLVPQDPNEEPASILLERVRKEKEKLIAEGKIKKDKNESIIYRRDNSYYEKLNGGDICINEKVSTIFPESWVLVKHNDYFEIIGGSQPPKSKFSNVKKPNYIRLYQIRDYGKHPEPVYIEEKYALKRTTKYDILLARYGASLGKVFYAHEGAYNVAMAKVVDIYPIKLMTLDFRYYYYLSNDYQIIVKNNSRSAQGGFNKKDLTDLIVPIPPLKEQQRIVEFLQTVFSLLE